MKIEKIDPIFQKQIKNKGSNTSENKQFRVIISFDDSKKRDNFITKNKNLGSLRKFDLIPSLYLKLKKKQIIELEKEDLIKRIEEDQQLFLSLLEINKTLNLNRSKNSQVSHTGNNVIIGIIDDGINDEFPSISKNIKKIRINDDLKKDRGNQITHGTIMANIITNQFTEDGYTAIGVAPDAEIVDLDISNPEKEFYFSDILRIFDIITKRNINLDLILISLTTKHPSDGNDILSRACDLLVDKGILIICPSGNYGPDPSTIGSPAAANKVISIGSTTKEFKITPYSGRGPTIDKRLKPDFCLPGSKIQVPLTDELKSTVTGSSVSAAIGAGLIALIKEYKPDFSYNEIFDLLKNYSIDLEVDKYSQGYGMPNISAIFDKFNLIHERVIPFDYLIKKSFKITIGFIIFVIVVFYFLYFFRIT